MTPSRYKIGTVAEMIGVSVTTIKNYEASGRIPPAERTPMGFRLYKPEQLPQISAAILGSRGR